MLICRQVKKTNKTNIFQQKREIFCAGFEAKKGRHAPDDIAILVLRLTDGLY